MALENLKIQQHERDEILDDSRLFDRSRKATIEQDEECEEMNVSLEDDELAQPNQIKERKSAFASPSPQNRQLLG